VEVTSGAIASRDAYRFNHDALAVLVDYVRVDIQSLLVFFGAKMGVGDFFDFECFGCEWLSSWCRRSQDNRTSVSKEGRTRVGHLVARNERKSGRNEASSD
jgi:hypothetical protein